MMSAMYEVRNGPGADHKTHDQSDAFHRCLVKQAFEIRKGKVGFWQGLVRNWSDDR